MVDHKLKQKLVKDIFSFHLLDIDGETCEGELTIYSQVAFAIIVPPENIFELYGE